MPNKTPHASEKEPVVVNVTQEHHIAVARQAARALAEAIGFGQTATYDLATSVSELASNLFFHATGGSAISLVALRRRDKVGIEVTAEDRGPGISDVDLAMRDDFSTSGGLGGGLPGAQRLMDEFEITSTVGVGTRIVARKWQPCR